MIQKYSSKLLLLHNDTDANHRSLKNSFGKEELLLVKQKCGQTRWATCDQVFLNCPTFALFTNEIIDSKSPYFIWLCEKLSLPNWNPENNLAAELKLGVTEMKGSPENWELIQQYVFKALESIIPLLPEPANPLCPPWVASILRLPIFPVTSPDGSNNIKRLCGSIFVPDSELLRPHFQGKVDMLDFGASHIWDILPVLRCSKVNLKYLSDYNNRDAMEIRVMPPEHEDVKITDIIRAKKTALTR